MDGTFLVEVDSTIKITSGAEEVHSRFAIIALIAVIHLGLCEDQNLGAEQVPLYLCTVGFEEGFVARRGPVEGKEVVDLDTGGGALSSAWGVSCVQKAKRGTNFFFSDEDCHGGVEAGAEGDTAGSFDLELVDYPLRPICGTVDLYLGRHEADCVGLGDGILEVPAIL